MEKKKKDDVKNLTGRTDNVKFSKIYWACSARILVKIIIWIMEHHSIS